MGWWVRSWRQQQDWQAQLQTHWQGVQSHRTQVRREQYAWWWKSGLAKSPQHQKSPWWWVRSEVKTSGCRSERYVASRRYDCSIDQAGAPGKDMILNAAPEWRWEASRVASHIIFLHSSFHTSQIRGYTTNESTNELRYTTTLFMSLAFFRCLIQHRTRYMFNKV